MIATAALVVAVGALVVVLLSAYHERGDALHAVIRQEQALRASSRVLNTVIDIETGVRGYQLTRQRLYLQPERTGLRAVRGNTERLRRLAGPQQPLAASIAREAAAYAAYARGVAAEVARRPLTLAEQRGRTRIGKHDVDAIRAALQRFDGNQQAQLVRTEARAVHASARSRATAVWVLVGLVVALALFGIAIGRGVIIPLERRAAEERRADLEAFNAELRAANEDLESYAYVTSHDLGEPLRTMAGFAELLERRAGDKLSDEERSFIDHITAASDRMRALIDDLLAYARSGGADIKVATVDTQSSVRDVAVRLHANGRVRSNGLPTVLADPVLLNLVFQNLISNALKFSPDDTPVTVGAQREDRWWRFDVRDEGIGIAPQHAELVFGMFKRLNSQDRYPGTGMGLAISQRIVERHGGRIWVTPAEGGGSVFSFTLPRDREAVETAVHS